MEHIWKDYYLTLPAAEDGGTNWRVRKDNALGEIIAQGFAVTRPGETAPRVRLNAIAADLLYGMPVFSGSGATFPPMSATLFVEYYTGSSWEDVDTIAFCNDWSYEDIDPIYGIDRPISLEVMRGGLLLIPVIDEEAVSIQAVFTKEDGTTYSKSYDIQRNPDTIDTDWPIGQVVINLAAEPQAVRVSILHNYDIVCGHRYQLIYRNEFGGWEQFTPARYETMSDGYNRHNIETADGVSTIAGEIERGIRFRTGVLTAEGAGNVHHLLGAVQVYLHDVNTGATAPVVLTDTSAEYKTFRNQGGQRVEYTFGIRLALTYQRR